jgi:tRNA (guanine37-N1)-methyltransferase
MTFDIVTIFPAMIEQAVTAGIVGRAIERGTLDVKVHDLRDFTTDRHRVVDDMPYGGGPGMVLKPEPIFRTLDAIEAERGRPLTVVLTSPQGTGSRKPRRGESAVACRALCGAVRGVDERVRARHREDFDRGLRAERWRAPALVILDAVARCVPGVVGDQQSVAEDSFSRGLLDFPQYTRPAEVTWPDPVGPAVLRVPDVLLSGNHADIRRWRKREALSRTLARRPELLSEAALDEEEQGILRELVAERAKGVGL